MRQSTLPIRFKFCSTSCCFVLQLFCIRQHFCHLHRRKHQNVTKGGHPFFENSFICCTLPSAQSFLFLVINISAHRPGTAPEIKYTLPSCLANAFPRQHNRLPYIFEYYFFFSFFTAAKYLLIVNIVC